MASSGDRIQTHICITPNLEFSPLQDCLRLWFYVTCLLVWSLTMAAFSGSVLLWKDIPLCHFAGCNLFPVQLRDGYITMGMTISQCHLSFDLKGEYQLIYRQNCRGPDDGASLFYWTEVVYPFFIASAYCEPYCSMGSVITKQDERYSGCLLG